MKEETDKKPALTPKKMVLNIAVFLGLFFVTFWFIFRGQSLGAILAVIGRAHILPILLGFLCMFGYFAMEAWNIMSLLKSFGEKITFFRALKFTMIGFFFCAVTPGASGGQPLEIYYMSKEKINAGNATIAILIQTCGIQIAVTAFGFICAILGHDILNEGPMLWLFLIGLLINAFALLILGLCILYPNGLRKVLKGFMNFLYYLGLKRARSWEKNIESGLDQYAESSKYIKTHRNEMVKSILKTFAQMAFFFTIPFCVYLAFGLSGHSFFTIFAMQAILFVSTSGLPIPGAIGASEGVFLSLYSAVFGEELLSSAMLLNRGINFYWFVIVSMVVVFINIVRLNRSSEQPKLKK
ncbi:MAG: lysylphosphatidylglycerol synthase transmembrane domain-containing protein [Candidatus Saccharibacteria bacterium]|nr:lysylphosphatidylglycerol synthase transmembrane domain-containing protein [Candidatus Saccharibacteria bacterium]